LRASGDAFTRSPPPVDGTPWGVWGAISGPPISFGELAPARCPDPTVVWGAISGPPISFGELAPARCPEPTVATALCPDSAVATARCAVCLGAVGAVDGAGLRAAG